MAKPAGGALLDDLLTGLEVRVDAFALCRVARGRALALHAMPSPIIHYALRGPGVLRAGDGPAIPFAQHGFILLPPGVPHRIEAPESGEVACTVDAAEELERLPALADGLLEVATGGTTAGGAVVACGAITAAYGAGLGLFDALREPVAEQLAPGEPLHGAFEAMLSELASPRFGTRAIAAALLKQCLVWLLRRRLDGAAENGAALGSPWPLCAVEPGLAGAVRYVLDRPAHPYTVASLARTAGMGRSAFAARFQHVFGRSPMEFVKRVRLRHAAWLLEATDLPVAALASAVGYESRSYLSRAFRAAYGADPTAYRAARRTSGRSSTPGRR
ncbi:MAG TPA: helix-turn-helix domain-containing protein [Falsiroseomonas sp.]|jgi:AraC-like DNA-binding protein|nr:helix-turn-helix domain-containing protein [Falsiroseomonas sp.]